MRAKLLVVGIIVLIVAIAGWVLLRTGDAAPKTRSEPVIQARWSEATGERMIEQATKSKLDYSLPELRVYDSAGRLIYRKTGAEPGETAEALNGALEADEAVSGPTFGETIGELETVDHQPLKIGPGPGVTVVDYWAEWCVPCKILDKELSAWAATRPPDSIRIVKAEADLPKLLRELGGKVVVRKRGEPVLLDAH